MRLALAMGMPVRRLLEEHTSAELSEWLAFDHAFNLPDGFYQAATTSMAVVRSMSGADVGPGDFAPIFLPPERADVGIQSADEGLAALRAFARAHNHNLKSKG